MQKDLAQMLGITSAAINKSMDGSITFDKLGRIAAALNVPIADLIDDPSSPPKVCPYCGSPLERVCSIMNEGGVIVASASAMQ